MPTERVQRQIDRLLDEAEERLRAFDWTALSQRARAVLALDAENADALTYLDAATRQGADEATPSRGSDADAEARPLPASFAGGRYQFRAFLGEGGTKRVYLAHDASLDRDVAVALIKTEGLDSEGLLRAKREAQSMARLGDHPAIVTIHDIGEEDGQPYIVSQHMHGGSVDDALRAAEDHRLPIHDALRIAEDVCDALVHAHGQGIVHRDLKPGNIWLGAGGAAKLGDFGLAVALDRSRLTMAGMMVGTVAYIAPEQALGGTPDARSDLYALGAALYEMVTGRPPFLGDDAVAVISQHINTPPVSPAWLNPEVPPALDALILRLLEKDPARRPASAAELRTLLATAAAAPGPRSASAIGPQPTAAASPMYRRTFIGREPELRQLQAAFDGALSGEGALTMVVGEPGIGKTSVCEQLATYVALRGGRTIVGHCYEEGSLSLPYLPFVEAMRTLVLATEPDDLKRELGSGAAEVARIVSEIRERVEIEPAPVTDPEEERYRLLQAVTAFLANASLVQPLLIVLEDLHDADRGTLDLLTHLARSLSGARLLVIGTYRDVEVDRSHPLANALVELRRSSQFGRVLLRGLTADEVHRMLSSIANQDVGWSLAEAVHRQTEGNPLFVQEVTRYLAEEGLVTRDGGRWRSTTEQLALSIPEGLRDVIGKRLSRLSEECNRLLAIAAVAGRDFALATLRAIATVPEDDLLQALEEAVRVGVLEERSRAGDVRYRFAHAFFRQSLYEELIAPRRIRLHQQIARALEDQYAGRLDEHAAELAEHFSYSSDASDLGKAVSYGEMAAARASAVYAHAEAASLLQRATEVQEVLDPADTGKRCDLLIAQVQPRRYAGDIDGARARAFEAGDVARAVGDNSRLVRAALAASEIIWIMGVEDLPAWNLLSDAYAVLDPSDGAARSRLLARMATIRVSAGDPDEARRHAAEALDLARSLGDPALMLAALRARLLTTRNRPDEISLRRAIIDDMDQAADAAGDVEQRAISSMTRASIALQENNIADARRYVAAMVEAAERYRLNVDIRAGVMWQSELARIAGDFDTAEQLMTQALDGQLIQWRELQELQSGGPQLSLLQAQQGRLAEIEQRLQAPIAMQTVGRIGASRRAFTHALLGQLDECRVAFEDVARDGFEWIPNETQAAFHLACAAEACAALSDRERAQPLYDVLVPFAGYNLLIRARTTAFYGSADRYLGMLATLLERWDDAQRHFEQSIRMAEAFESPPYAAQSQYDYARMLIARDAAGDRQRALSLLADAGETARRIGMRALLEQVLALRIDAQGLTSTNVMTSISAVASAAQREQTDLRPHAAPDGGVTIMFSDIEGSTEINEHLGDQDWMEWLRAHNGIMRAQLKDFGGHEVKTAGDGFMVAFQSPLRAVECAIAIQRAFAAHNDEHTQHPLRVRIGLHTGTPVAEGGDYYGKDVTLAARIADEADGGEIVISEALHHLLQGEPGVLVGDTRALELKGLAGRYEIVPVRWSEQRSIADS